MEHSPKDKNYELKSKAVDDLLSDDIPQYSPEELDRYRKKTAFKLPELLIILFTKAWFAGAVCYFVVWGLAMYLPGVIEKMFVLGAAMGMVVDLLLNNVIRYFEKTPGARDRWLLVTKKGVVGFGLNLLYGFVVVLCVYWVYNSVNILATNITGVQDQIVLPVEPILFGLLSMGFDMLFITMKHLAQRILRDAMDKAS